MQLKWLVAVLLICILPSASEADEFRQVDGVIYEEESGTWYLFDTSGERWEIRRGRLGARFEANFPQDSVATAFAELGMSLREPRIDPGGFYRFSYSDSLEPPSVLAAVLSMPHVENAYLDSYLKFFATANDSFYVNQWNIVKARVDMGWDVTTGADSVTIAIIDRGFEIGHEDFQDVIWINPAEDINHNGIFDNFSASSGGDIDSTDNDVPPNYRKDDVIGWDFTSGDNDPRPTAADKHGTLVAGIACAAANNDIGLPAWLAEATALESD